MTREKKSNSPSSPSADIIEFRRRFESVPDPTFVSMDGRCVFKHKPLSIESFILLKELPGKFTIAFKQSYEASLNGKKKTGEEMVAEMKDEVEQNFEEHIDALKKLAVHTITSPRFTLGDTTDAAISVEMILDYLNEYYWYLVSEFMPHRNVKMNGREVSQDELITFPDGERPAEPQGDRGASEVLG